MYKTIPSMDGKMLEQIKKADIIYEKIRFQLEKNYFGQIVAIDEQSGDYFIGKTELEACEKAKNKFPDSILVCKRIGAKATHFVGII